jgi:hypothetical protein
MPDFKIHVDASLHRYHVLASSGDLNLLKAACVTERELPITIEHLDNGLWGAVIPWNSWELASTDTQVRILQTSKDIQQRMTRLTSFWKIIAFLFLWVPGVSLLEAYTLKVVWAWHIVPLTGWQQISLKAAFVITFLLSSAVVRPTRIRISDMGDKLAPAGYAIPIVSCLLVLLVAWLCK